MAQIIFLHGASSSGKSTLARALQARIDTPFWHVSADRLWDNHVLPMERFRSGEFAWGAVRGALFDGFHRSVATYADAGNDLILEHILDTEDWLDLLRGLLGRHDVLFVAVHCPPEQLATREKARGNRPIGSARRDHETIHAGLRYDLELDGTAPVEANVARVLAARKNPRRASSFPPPPALGTPRPSCPRGATGGSPAPITAIPSCSFLSPMRICA